MWVLSVISDSNPLNVVGVFKNKPTEEEFNKLVEPYGLKDFYSAFDTETEVWDDDGSNGISLMKVPFYDN